MLYFAKSTLSFYDSDIHGKRIPSDAIEITKEQHQALMKEHSATGHPIQADGKGHPICVPVAPTPEQEYAVLKHQATKALKDSDIVVLRHYEDGEQVPAEWVAYRRALREVIAGGLKTIPDAPAAIK